MIGTIPIAWITSSSIRTIGAIVKICKRLNPLSHDADDRSDPNISQHAPVIPRFNALSALRSKKFVAKWHNKHERVETKLFHQCIVQQAAKFSYKSIFNYAYSFFKENKSAINRLPLGFYALIYRTPAKITLPPQAQTVQYRFLRRSR